MLKKEKAEDILKHYKLSQTKIRKNILSCFLKSDGPLSILDFKKENFFSCFNESSFYRTLDVFKTKGIVQVIPGEKNYQLYKLIYKRHNHHHLITCQNCSSQSHLDICSLDTIFNDLAEKKGFQHLGHKIELSGLCNDCTSS